MPVSCGFLFSCLANYVCQPTITKMTIPITKTIKLSLQPTSFQNYHNKHRSHIPWQIILFSSFFFIGCGDVTVPSVKEKDVIRNHVGGAGALGSILNAEVSAYELVEDAVDCGLNSLRKLSTARLDEDGNFNLSLDVNSGFILYKLEGGTYIEDASQQAISMTEDQSLFAVSFYDSTAPQLVTISPWSHLQTGLFCWMLETEDSHQAEIEAREFLISMFGFNPLYSNIRVPTLTTNNRVDVPFDNAMKLGFMNAALSQLSLKLSRRLETIDHLTINSIYMAQLLYEDIYNDGTLDGQGGYGPLYIVGATNTHLLSAASYRVELPRQLLEFYDSNPYNKVANKGRGHLYSLASTINSNNHPTVFNNQPPNAPLDDAPPSVIWLSENVLTGIVNISFKIEDLTGVDRAALSFYSSNGKEAISYSKDDDIYFVNLDTGKDGNGQIVYRVQASDALGNNRTYSFPIQLINDPPSLEVDALSYTNEKSYSFTAEFNPVSPQQQIKRGECVLGEIQFAATINQEKKEIDCSVSLSRSGDNYIEIKICDDRDLCISKEHRVVYDSQAPQISPINERTIYQSNISLLFSIFDATTRLQGSIEWEVSGNQQIVHGKARMVGEDEYSIFADATPFGSNQVMLIVRVRDILNNTAEYVKSYQVSNSPASAEVISAPRFKEDYHILAFEVMENSFRNLAVSCQIDGFGGFTPGIYIAGTGQCYLILPQAPDGHYKVNIRLCGDYNLCTTQTTSIIKDATGPLIHINEFPSKHTKNYINTFISATDAHSMVRKVVYQLDGSPPQPLSREGDNWLLSLEELNTGQHRLMVQAWDQVNNSAKLFYDFLILYDEPYLELVSMESTNMNDYILRAQVDSGSYNDTYSALCSFKDIDDINDIEVVGRINNELLSCRLDLTTVADGERRVVVTLTADYGISYEREVVLVKDTAAPRIDMSGLADEYTQGAIPISIGIVDAHSEITKAVYRLDEGTEKDLTQQANDWRFILSVDQLATGRHSVTVVAADGLGNEAEEQRSFLVLKDEPEIVWTSSNPVRTDTYSLTGRVDAGSYGGSYTVLCRLGSKEVIGSMTNRFLSCALNLATVSDGNHTIRVTLTADYGRSYIRDFTLVKDTEAPLIEFVDLQESYGNGTFPLSIRIRDAHSGVAAAFYRLDGLNGGRETPLVRQAGDLWNFILPVARLETGRHQLMVRASDGAGNEGMVERYFLVLKDEPQLTLTSAERTRQDAYTLIARIDGGSYTGSYTSQCRLDGREVAGQLSRGNGGYQLLSCVLDLTTVADGERRVVVTLTADYGISYEREVVLVKDTAAPRIDMSGLADEYTQGAIPISIGIVDAHSEITKAVYRLDEGTEKDLTQQANDWRFILSVDQLATGRHSVTVVTADGLGNEAEEQRSFLVLKDEPEIVWTSSNPVRTDTYSLTGRLDARSYGGSYTVLCRLGSKEVIGSMTNGLLSCALNLAAVSDGNHTIRVTLMADYGRSYVRDFTLVKDTEAPLIEFVDLQESYGNGTFPLSIRIRDAHSGVAAAFYRLDGLNGGRETPLVRQAGDLWNFIVPVARLETDRHQLMVRASDGAGNEAMVERYFLILKDEPQLTLTSAGRTWQDAYTLIARIDGGSYTGSYTGQCELDGTTIPGQLSRGSDDYQLLSCVLDLTTVADGEWRVVVTLTADYDISYEREVVLVKDTAAPRIDMSGLADEYTQGAIPISIGIVDAHSKITKAVYRLDEGTEKDLTQQANDWGFILSVDQLATGRHSVTVVTADGLGNEAEEQRSFLVLKDEPEIVWTSSNPVRTDTYSLTGRLDAGSYGGSYTVLCRLGSKEVSGSMTNGLLSCALNLATVSDGNHTIRVTLTADYGRSYVREFTLVKDTEEPLIEFVDLQESYGNGTFPLSIRIRDAHSGVAAAFYRLDGLNGGRETPLVRQAGDLWNFILPVARLETGRHQLMVRASDGAGNEGMVEGVFLILKDEPQLTLTSAERTRQDAYTLIARIDDGSYTGSYTSQCQLDGTNIPGQLSRGNGGYQLLSCVLDLTTVADGERRVVVTLTADYGISYEREVVLVKDTAAPRIDMSGLADEYTQGAIPISIGIVDAHSKITKAVYRLDEGTEKDLTQEANDWRFILSVDQLATGRHSVTVVAADGLGNEAEEQRSFLVLKDEPEIVWTSSNPVRTDTYSLTGRVDAGSYGGSYTVLCRLGSKEVIGSMTNRFLSCALNLATVSDGNHTIRVTLTADYGRSYVREFTLVKDTEEPLIEFVDLQESYGNGTFPLSIRIRDAHSGVAAAFYRLDGLNGGRETPLVRQAGDLWNFILPVARLETGRHQLMVRASDGAGNEGMVEGVFLILKDEPQLTLTSAERTRQDAYTLIARIDDGSYTGSYTSQCQLDGTNIPGQLSRGNGGYQLLSCVLDLTTVADGERRVVVTLTADYGISYEREVVLVKDTAAPRIDMSGLADEYTQGAIPISIGIVDAHSKITKAVYRLDEGTEKDLTQEANDWRFILSVDQLATGRHSVTVVAADGLGNEAEEQRSFLVLKDEPEIVWTSSNPVRTDTYSLTGRVDAGSYGGSYTVLCRLGSKEVIGSMTNRFLSCALNLATVSDGSHTIRVILTADYGRSYVRDFTLVKDTEAPLIEFVDLQESYGNGTFPLSIRIRDAHSGVAAAFYRLDGLNGGRETPLVRQAGDLWNFILPVARLETGRHQLMVRASDGAGNEGMVERYFLVLKDEPQLTLTSAGRTRQDAYTLIARIDDGSHTGSYTSQCQLDGTNIPGQLSRGNGGYQLLSCVLDLTTVADGERRVVVTLTADYGISYEREVVLVKDTAAPRIDMSGLADEYTQGAIPISIGIVDAHSEITNAVYRLDEGTEKDLTQQANDWRFILSVDQLATGRHSVTVVAADGLGNEAEEQRSFLVLKDEPEIVWTSSNPVRTDTYSLTGRLDARSYGGSYTVLCRLGSKEVIGSMTNGLLSCALNLAAVSDGNHTIRVTLMADYGRSYVRDFTLVKDTEAPLIEFVDLQESYGNGTFPLSIRIRDAHSGVAAAFYRLDGLNGGRETPLVRQAGDLWNFIVPVTRLETDRHQLMVRASDGAGNEGMVERYFLVLKDEPQLTLTSAGRIRQDAYTLIARIDGGSHTGSYTGQCELDGTKMPGQLSRGSDDYQLLSCVLDLTTVADGEWRVVVTLTADYDISYEREVVLVKDTVAPRIDMSGLADEYTQGAIPISIGIVDAHSEIARAVYRLDEETAEDLTQQANDWGFILSVDQLATGRHSVTVVTADGLGNEAEEQRSFLVLKDEPSLARISETRTKNQAYTLRAELNPYSYQGNYQAHCSINSATVLASIISGTLGCPLDLTNLIDGNWTVNVDLVADYGTIYKRSVFFIKDTTPPEIQIYNRQNVYKDDPITLEFTVTDNLSPIESLVYSYEDRSQPLRYLGNNFWTLSINLENSGEYRLSLIARDALANERQQDFSILLVKETPQLSFTHSRLVQHSVIDITGNISLATPLAPVADIHCLVPNEMEIKANIDGDLFSCKNYNVQDYDEKPINVRVCDIYDNCALFQTYVSQDARPPIITGGLSEQLLTYHSSCIPYQQGNYDDISSDCRTEIRGTAGLLQLDDSETEGALLNPKPFILYQNATSFGVLDPFDRAALTAVGIGYVTFNAADVSDPRFYFTRPDDLNISYSYSQLVCLVDNEQCPDEKRNYYFKHKPLSASLYREGKVEKIITFTNEFLNHETKPIWYLAPTGTIHRLELSVCDEAKNCVVKIIRFRIKLHAREPLVTAKISQNSIRLLKDAQDYSQVFGSGVSTVRIWEIYNPSNYPVWVRIESVEKLTALYKYADIRKQNKYRKHTIREWRHSSYLPGNASCGRRPFPDRSRRPKYRIYRQYLSEDWVYAFDSPEGDRGHAYGPHGYEWKDRENCSGATDRIIEFRYQIGSGYPRIVTSNRYSIKHEFIHTFHHYYRNNQGGALDAYPVNGFYQIGAQTKLIVQTSETLPTDPRFYTDRTAIFAHHKTIDDEREITIPLGLNFSFTPSAYNEQEQAEPDVRSIRTAEQSIPTKVFRKTLERICARDCPSRAENWQEIN